VLGCWRPKFGGFNKQVWFWHDLGGPSEFWRGGGEVEQPKSPNPTPVRHCLQLVAFFGSDIYQLRES